MKEPSLSNKKTQGLFGTYPLFYLPLHRFQNESTSGKVLEWLKRHAWKACNRQNWFAGSNPVLSAPDFQKEDSHGSSFFAYGKLADAVNEETTFAKLHVYTYKKGMQKTMQTIHRTLHNPLHLFDYLNITQCMIFVLNPTQTLH